jgi:hypothetical protein
MEVDLLRKTAHSYLSALGTLIVKVLFDSIGANYTSAILILISGWLSGRREVNEQ